MLPDVRADARKLTYRFFSLDANRGVIPGFFVLSRIRNVKPSAWGAVFSIDGIVLESYSVNTAHGVDSLLRAFYLE